MTHSSDDRFQNSVDIRKHIIVPKAQNEIAVSFQISRPFRVFDATFGVLPTIKLDN